MANFFDLQGGWRVQNDSPIDSRFTVADEAARLAIPAGARYAGLLVYQQDTDVLYKYTSDDTWESVEQAEYEPTPATATELGSVIVEDSSDINIDGDGKLTLGSLDASKIDTGTISESLLPSNIAKTDTENTFSEKQTFNSTDTDFTTKATINRSSGLFPPHLSLNQTGSAGAYGDIQFEQNDDVQAKIESIANGTDVEVRVYAGNTADGVESNPTLSITPDGIHIGSSETLSAENINILVDIPELPDGNDETQSKVLRITGGVGDPTYSWEDEKDIDLNDLDSVLITGLATADFLRYNGTNWVNVQLTQDLLPDLPASKITSGEFNTARIPNLSATKITSGLLGEARIPLLTTDKIPTLDPTSKLSSGTESANRVLEADGTGGVRWADQADVTVNKTVVDNAIGVSAGGNAQQFYNEQGDFVSVTATTVNDLLGISSTGNDALFMNEQGDFTNITFDDISGDISNSQITNSSLPLNKIAQNGATNGQVIAWNGSAWVATDNAADDLDLTGNVDISRGSGDYTTVIGGNQNDTLTVNSNATFVNDATLQGDVDIDGTLRIPTSTPGAFVNGQIWYDGTSIQARVNGATQSLGLGALTGDVDISRGSGANITRIGTDANDELSVFSHTDFGNDVDFNGNVTLGNSEIDTVTLNGRLNVSNDTGRIVFPVNNTDAFGRTTGEIYRNSETGRYYGVHVDEEMLLSGPWSIEDYDPDGLDWEGNAAVHEDSEEPFLITRNTGVLTDDESVGHWHFQGRVNSGQSATTNIVGIRGEAKVSGGDVTDGSIYIQGLVDGSEEQELASFHKGTSRVRSALRIYNNLDAQDVALRVDDGEVLFRGARDAGEANIENLFDLVTATDTDNAKLTLSTDLTLDQIAGTGSYLGIDSDGNVTKVAITGGSGIPVVSADPASPSEGDIWFHTGDDVIRYSDGTNDFTVVNLEDNQTFAGNISVTGNLDVDGTTTLDDVTIDGTFTIPTTSTTTEGTVWYNTTSNTVEYRDDAGTETVASQSYVDSHSTNAVGHTYRNIRVDNGTMRLDTYDGDALIDDGYFGESLVGGTRIFDWRGGDGNGDDYRGEDWNDLGDETYIRMKPADDPFADYSYYRTSNFTYDALDVNGSADNLEHIHGHDYYTDDDYDGDEFYVEFEYFNGVSTFRTDVDGLVPAPTSSEDESTHVLRGNGTWADITLSDLSEITATAAEINVLDGIPSTLTATELGYVDGVTSAIQTQIDSKQATLTFGAGFQNNSNTINLVLNTNGGIETTGDDNEIGIKLDGTTLQLDSDGLSLNLSSANTWTGDTAFNSDVELTGLVNIGGENAISNTQGAIAAATNNAIDTSNGIFINDINHYNGDRAQFNTWIGQDSGDLTDDSQFYSHRIFSRYNHGTDGYQTSGEPLASQFAYYKEDSDENGYGAWEFNVQKIQGDETSIVLTDKLFGVYKDYLENGQEAYFTVTDETTTAFNDVILGRSDKTVKAGTGYSAHDDDDFVTKSYVDNLVQTPHIHNANNFANELAIIGAEEDSNLAFTPDVNSSSYAFGEQGPWYAIWSHDTNDNENQITFDSSDWGRYVFASNSSIINDTFDSAEVFRLKADKATISGDAPNIPWNIRFLNLQDDVTAKLSVRVLRGVDWPNTEGDSVSISPTSGTEIYSTGSQTVLATNPNGNVDIDFNLRRTSSDDTSLEAGDAIWIVMWLQRVNDEDLIESSFNFVGNNSSNPTYTLPIKVQNYQDTFTLGSEGDLTLKKGNETARTIYDYDASGYTGGVLDVHNARIDHNLEVFGNTQLGSTGASSDTTIINGHLRVPVLEPTGSIADGTLYYDSTDEGLKIRANGSWVDAGGEGGSDYDPTELSFTAPVEGERTDDDAGDARSNFEAFKNMDSVDAFLDGYTSKGLYYYGSSQSSTGGYEDGELARIVRAGSTVTTDKQYGLIIKVFHYNSSGDLAREDLTLLKANPDEVEESDLNAVLFEGGFTWGTSQDSDLTPTSSDGSGGAKYNIGDWIGYSRTAAASRSWEARFLGSKNYTYDSDGNLTYVNYVSREGTS